MSEEEKVSSMEKAETAVTAEETSSPKAQAPVTIIVEPQPDLVAPRTRGIRIAALSGFSLGVFGTIGYLLAGGHYFFFPFGCLWVDHFAFVAFNVPGHIFAYDLRVPALFVKLVCVLVVGLTWGLIALLARRVWLAAKSNSPRDVA